LKYAENKKDKLSVSSLNRMSEPVTTTRPTIVEEAGTRSPRFLSWMAFLVFSCIVLGSVIQAAEQNQQRNSSVSETKWAVACAALTFIFTFVAVVAHFVIIFSICFVGTKVEGLMIILLIAFWASGVKVITDPQNGLAVTNDGAIENGNLYYFSWAGLVCSIMLLTSFLKSVYSLDLAGEINTRSARLNFWSGFMICSLIVMGASANVWDLNCSAGYEGTSYCRRTVLGIVLGAVGAVMSLYVVAMKIATRRTFFVVESLFSALMVLCYAFGVALITAERGPGSAIGNLYYFTWASFLLAFVLCSSLYEEYHSLRNPSHDPTIPHSNAVPPQQNMDDEI